MKKNLVVLDIGTQSIRSAVVSQDGEIAHISQTQQQVESPYPGWAQQRPESWWEIACETIQRVLEKTGAPKDSIAGFCCCGQMHGPVGIDEEGDITTEWTQIWCDKRCQEQCDAFLEDWDDEPLARVTGNRVSSGWVGFKVLWIKERQPEIFDRTRWFLVPKDFINFKLTGAAATDPSEASGTYLWDTEKDSYSQGMADLLELSLERFAPVRGSQEVIGAVHEAAARETGLPAGIPVVAGGADFIVSLLGMGIAGYSTAAEVTGTSTLFVVHREKPLIEEGISNLRHVVEGWLPFIMLDCGGLSMKWCRDLFSSGSGGPVSYEALIEKASTVEPGCEGLFFYPYMLGERRRDNTEAQGAFLGLRLNHNVAHVARSVMEGTAMAVGRGIRAVEECGVEIERIRCAGGGTRNALWNRIKADVYGVPIELLDEPEAGVKGAALLAAAGAGLVTDATAAARERAAVSKVIMPDPERITAYRSLSSDFERIYENMLGFYKEQPQGVGPRAQDLLV